MSAPPPPAGGIVGKIATCFLPFAAGYFLSYLYRTVNAVIAPNLDAAFTLDASALGLLTSAYFFGFSLVQLPLGAALDRLGPRRTNAALLLIAAIGAVVFAAAPNLATLAAGRLLIGVGVSMCLMAAFKANSQFWPRERLPLANGVLMAFGGLGSAVATLPVEWLLHVMNWRGVFVLIALVTVAVSIYLVVAVPERATPSAATWRDEITYAREIFSSPDFWRIAPSMVAAQSTYISYVSLWIGPWLRDVAGHDRATAAGLLAIITTAFMLGSALQGLVGDRAMRRGIPLTSVLAGYAVCFLVVEVPLIFGVTAASTATWSLFALLGAGSTLGYAILQHQFPPSLAGRVSCCMNLLIFVMAFFVQWGIGVVIDLAGPTTPARGHSIALAILATAQVAALVWLLSRRPAT
ncbi:MAG: MFS transporter [Alphaproteobacteria bacterium]|nr:MFS transporter [Alphaproteobacteria bacterium]